LRNTYREKKGSPEEKEVKLDVIRYEELAQDEKSGLEEILAVSKYCKLQCL